MNSLWAEGKLWQGLVPTVATKLYTPSLIKSGQVKIENIFIANKAATGVSFTMWTGPTATDDKLIFPAALVQPNTLWAPLVVLYLGFGDSVWGLASAAGITLTINGGVRQ